MTRIGNGNLEDDVDTPEIYAQRASQSFIAEVWGRITRRIPPMAGADRLRRAVHPNAGFPPGN